MAANTFDTSLVLQVAAISRYLAEKDIILQEKLKGYRGATTDPLLPVKIYIVEKGVRWKYEGDPANDTLPATTNYLWSLLGRYTKQALGILGQGGGGIIVVPSTGQTLNLRWVTTSFTVGNANSLMPAGENQFTISLTNILFDSVSFGFSNSSPLPRTGTVDADQTTYAVQYFQSGIVITLSYNVTDGQQYTISFGRSAAGSSFQPQQLPIPIPLLQGQFLSNDGTTLVWNEQEITITSANFEPDGVTYHNPQFAYHDFDVRLEDTGGTLLVAGVDYIKIFSSSDMQMLIPGFDANINNYKLTIMFKGA